MTSLRVGQGFDAHRWSDDPARELVLGGVRFPGERGLDGHSDADAVAHAVIDAVLGAAGHGDIGQLFPDDDASLAGADSVELLRQTIARIHRDGWTVENVDCTIILDQPKVAPVRDEIQRLLSDVCGGPITVKGKRTEGLVGLSDGVQCHAVALLVRS